MRAGWSIARGSAMASRVSNGALDAMTRLQYDFDWWNGAQVGADRYAWLGAQQRAADNPDGIVLFSTRRTDRIAPAVIVVGPA